MTWPSAIQEFESFLNSTLSSDLSSEIGGIMATVRRYQREPSVEDDGILSGAHPAPDSHATGTNTKIPRPLLGIPRQGKGKLSTPAITTLKSPGEVPCQLDGKSKGDPTAPLLMELKSERYPVPTVSDTAKDLARRLDGMLFELDTLKNQVSGLLHPDSSPHSPTHDISEQPIKGDIPPSVHSFINRQITCAIERHEVDFCARTLKRQLEDELAVMETRLLSVIDRKVQTALARSRKDAERHAMDAPSYQPSGLERRRAIEKSVDKEAKGDVDADVEDLLRRLKRKLEHKAKLVRELNTKPKGITFVKGDTSAAFGPDVSSAKTQPIPLSETAKSKIRSKSSASFVPSSSTGSSYAKPTLASKLKSKNRASCTSNAR
ncbi:hypothetical protein HK104_003780 [Borealophlyctis nickersoniae]|nr:hypothetical protein HK104_003780 [Borealophlyctis nickersoniae]